MITVAIATKDRANALKNISLPSLLEQDFKDFEIVIWDASNDDSSENIVKDLSASFADREVAVKYFKASRKGSASQRNDLINEARGEIVFFIDDDSDVSHDGISALYDTFKGNKSLFGAGLQVFEQPVGQPVEGPDSDRLKEKIYSFIGYRRKRRVNPSGSAKGITAPPGPAEWLSGCSMAFRREVFEQMNFNEKLETFGPYAMCEDIEFSHRVFLHYKKPLMICKRGCLYHRPTLGGRIAGSDKRIAMIVFNRFLSMKVACRRSPLLGYLGYTWSMLRFFFRSSVKDGFDITSKGFSMAIREMKKVVR